MIKIKVLNDLIVNIYIVCVIFSELEQLQNEKRKALLEHETAKLRECDDALQRDLRDWKGQLLPRKQVIFLYIFYRIFRQETDNIKQVKIALKKFSLIKKRIL